MIALHSFSFIISMIFCLLFYILQVEPLHPEEGLELMFRERSESDWTDVWHHETHSRCREKLVRQLFWACEKDIYRLTRRNRKRNELISNDASKLIKKHVDKIELLSPNPNWLHSNFANMILRTRRSDAPSITNECCTKTGCTWEEYAEYCPSNKRRNHY